MILATLNRFSCHCSALFGDGFFVLCLLAGLRSLPGVFPDAALERGITPLSRIGVVPQSLPGVFPGAAYAKYLPWSLILPVRVDGAAHLYFYFWPIVPVHIYFIVGALCLPLVESTPLSSCLLFLLRWCPPSGTPQEEMEQGCFPAMALMDVTRRRGFPPLTTRASCCSMVGMGLYGRGDGGCHFT